MTPDELIEAAARANHRSILDVKEHYDFIRSALPEGVVLTNSGLARLEPTGWDWCRKANSPIPTRRNFDPCGDDLPLFSLTLEEQ